MGESCSKIEKVGRTMVVCMLPLHHDPVRRPDGRLVVVHRGIVPAGTHEWEEEPE